MTTDYLPPVYEVPLDTVEALRQDMADLFTVTYTALDQPQPKYVTFYGRFLQDPAICFDDLRRRFEQNGFTPMIRKGEDDRLALIALPHVFNPPASRWIINLLLFLATVASTLWVGASYDLGLEVPWQEIWRGWPFSLSLLLILGAHELGHYFAARYHKVPVTLPYFIPLPGSFSLIGTLGAFIQLKAPVKNKRALLDVGAAGPLAGMVFAIPILLIGLATSPVHALPSNGYLAEGNSILYLAAKLLVFGKILPSGGEDVLLNQVAWAGWVGLLVTGLNLIPIGQLDGGHVAYVLFGKRARQLYWPVLIALLGLVLITGATMWILWIGLLFFMGRVYAEPLDDVTPLDGRRRAIAIFTLILFVLVFMPIPFQVVN